MSNSQTPERRARDLAIQKAGGGSSLARRLGLTRGAVTHWDVIPARHMMRVSEITGIPVADLRPDLALPAVAHPSEAA